MKLERLRREVGTLQESLQCRDDELLSQEEQISSLKQQISSLQHQLSVVDTAATGEEDRSASVPVRICNLSPDLPGLALSFPLRRTRFPPWLFFSLSYFSQQLQAELEELVEEKMSLQQMLQTYRKKADSLAESLRSENAEVSRLRHFEELVTVWNMALFVAVVDGVASTVG